MPYKNKKMINMMLFAREVIHATGINIPTRKKKVKKEER